MAAWGKPWQTRRGQRCRSRAGVCLIDAVGCRSAMRGGSVEARQRRAQSFPIRLEPRQPKSQPGRMLRPAMDEDAGAAEMGKKLRCVGTADQPEQGCAAHNV